MRFMVIVKATKESEAGEMPSSEMLAEMGKYNDELIKAGMMLAGEGLHPTSKGMRVKFDHGKTTVKDGPFAETKELVAGFWILKAKSREDVLDWVRRIPFEEGEVEVRQVFETEDFAVDDISREALEKEKAWRAANEKPVAR
jgi:hypothetical protein